MTLTIYGIKTCDTCRKAVKAFAVAGQDASFVDIRQTPLDKAQMEQFWQVFGQALLNTRSTTWRNLSDQERTQDPLELLISHPTLMKRPVIEAAGQLYLGWSKTVQEALL